MEKMSFNPWANTSSQIGNVSTTQVNSIVPIQQNLYAANQYSAFQQNWQQWQAYQQQYAQWHAQYGEQYEREMQKKLGTTAPALPGFIPPMTTPSYPTVAYPSYPPPVVTHYAPPPPPQIEQSSLSNAILKPPPPPPPRSELASGNVKREPKPVPPVSKSQNVQMSYNQNQNSEPSYLSQTTNSGQQSKLQTNKNNRAWENTQVFNRSTSCTDTNNTNFNNGKGNNNFRNQNENDRKYSMSNQKNKTDRFQGSSNNKSTLPVLEDNIKSKTTTNAELQPMPIEKEEELFDEQFKLWQLQFDEWKETNANHPDKRLYREYEQQFEECRKKLIERREHMRKRKIEQQKLLANSDEKPKEICNENQNYDSTCDDFSPTPAKQRRTQVIRNIKPIIIENKLLVKSSVQNEDSTVVNKPEEMSELFKKSGGIPGLDLVKNDIEATQNNSQPTDEIIDLDCDQPSLRPNEATKNIPSLFSITVEKPTFSPPLSKSNLNAEHKFASSFKENDKKSLDCSKLDSEQLSDNQALINSPLNSNPIEDSLKNNFGRNQSTQPIIPAADLVKVLEDPNILHLLSAALSTSQDQQVNPAALVQTLMAAGQTKQLAPQNHPWNNQSQMKPQPWANPNMNQNSGPWATPISPWANQQISQQWNNNQQHNSGQLNRHNSFRGRNNERNFNNMIGRDNNADNNNRNFDNRGNNNDRTFNNNGTNFENRGYNNSYDKFKGGGGDYGRGNQNNNRGNNRRFNNNQGNNHGGERMFSTGNNDRGNFEDNNEGIGFGQLERGNDNNSGQNQNKNFQQQNSWNSNNQGMNPFGESSSSSRNNEGNENDNNDKSFRPVKVIDYQNKSLNKSSPSTNNDLSTKVVDYGHRSNGGFNRRHETTSTSSPNKESVKTIDYGHGTTSNTNPQLYQRQRRDNPFAKDQENCENSNNNLDNNDHQNFEFRQQSDVPKRDVQISNFNYDIFKSTVAHSKRNLKIDHRSPNEEQNSFNKNKSQQNSLDDDDSQKSDLRASIENTSSLLDDDLENISDNEIETFESSKILSASKEQSQIQPSPPAPPQLFTMDQANDINPKMSYSENNINAQMISTMPIYNCVNSAIPSIQNHFKLGIDEILSSTGRLTRPKKIAIILRGPPGSGKSYLAKLIKHKETELGGSAPRILSIDDYYLIENDKEFVCPKTGKKIIEKVMVYEFETDMEVPYMQNLIKSFKKTLADNYFDFVIVDCSNHLISTLSEFYHLAKDANFMPYVIDLICDLETCLKNNIHNRSESDIKSILNNWMPTPMNYVQLDVQSLLKTDEIQEIEMVDDFNSGNQEELIEIDESTKDSTEDIENIGFLKSKWDTDTTNEKLARLDGTRKPFAKRQNITIEDYLQIDGWQPSPSSSNEKKRVRWADIEEKREQDKMRAIGFVVGQTDWNRMMDPTSGGSALTKTKYIERCNNKRRL